MASNDQPRFRHRLEYALYRAVERVLSTLPWSTVIQMGRALGIFFWAIDKRHRRTVRRNLRTTDLGLDDLAIRHLTKDCFAHYGAVFLSTVRLYAAEHEEGDPWVRVEGLEHYDAAVAMGKGVVQIGAHYGNWEAINFGMGRAGRHTYGIARSLANPLLDQALFASREAVGSSIIPKGGAVAKAVRALRQGGVVAFLMDQDALTNGVWVKFMGAWASTYPTAGNLAARLGAVVLPTHSWPEADGGIRVRFEAPFMVPTTGDLERDTWVATQLMTACLERQVRQDPRWYFWMHDRYKTRPGEGNPLPAPLPPPEWVESLQSFAF